MAALLALVRAGVRVDTSLQLLLHLLRPILMQLVPVDLREQDRATVVPVDLA
jgi:hypothetical protein